MSPEDFYRDPDRELCQGDIVRGVPSLYLKPPLQAVRRQNAAYSLHEFDPFDEPLASSRFPAPPGGFKFGDSGGELAATRCQVALGVVLSHGCEIDKDQKNRLVALVRPLDVVPNQEHQQTIRGNRNFSFFYLPDYPMRMGESYVDFRRLSTVHPTFVNPLMRVASLTERAADALLAQLFLFFTRRDLRQPPPNEG